MFARAGPSLVHCVEMSMVGRYCLTLVRVCSMKRGSTEMLNDSGVEALGNTKFSPVSSNVPAELQRTRL